MGVGVDNGVTVAVGTTRVGVVLAVGVELASKDSVKVTVGLTGV
jgi:hypothetical protein